MSAEEWIEVISLVDRKPVEDIKEVLLHAAELSSLSHTRSIYHIRNTLNVKESIAEILLAWGEKNYDIGPNQSFS
jgi:hypothetical protein